jgi:hypothetical protein
VPHSPIVRQVSSRVASLAGNRSVRTRGPAEAVEPERAVRFEHMAVRAQMRKLVASGPTSARGQAFHIGLRPLGQPRQKFLDSFQLAVR